MIKEPPIPVLIQFAAKRLSQTLDGRFEKAGLATLRPPQGQIMGLLYNRPQMSAIDIQKSLRISKSTVSGALSELVEAGYIQYVVNEENRREKIIIETEKGKLYRESAWKVMQQFVKDILAGLNDSEREALKHALNKIIENAEGGERG